MTRKGGNKLTLGKKKATPPSRHTAQTYVRRCAELPPQQSRQSTRLHRVLTPTNSGSLVSLLHSPFLAPSSLAPGGILARPVTTRGSLARHLFEGLTHAAAEEAGVDAGAGAGQHSPGIEKRPTETFPSSAHLRRVRVAAVRPSEDNDDERFPRAIRRGGCGPDADAAS